MWSQPGCSVVVRDYPYLARPKSAGELIDVINFIPRKEGTSDKPDKFLCAKNFLKTRALAL